MHALRSEGVVGGIVDAHFHVIAPAHQFPMQPDRNYTPPPAPLRSWRESLGPCGVTQGVVVQPSIYGADNRVMLAALAEGRGQLVGVAAVAAEVADAELDRLAAAGVRGVRLAHFEAGDPRAMGGFVSLTAFDALEDRLADRGMHLHLFTDSRLQPGIAERIARSRVPVVIDHMGRAPARLGPRHHGIRALVELMRGGPVWIKLSGIANVSVAGPEYEDARAFHEVLVSAAPARFVWGSDWPHTKPASSRPQTQALLKLFDAWTPERRRDQLAASNARLLYGLTTPAQDIVL